MASVKNDRIEAWVDARVAALGDPAWEPDTQAAIERLRTRRTAVARRMRPWMVTAAVAGVAVFGVVVLPAPRVLAQRCLNCSVALWQTLAAAGPGHANLIPETGRKPAPDFQLKDQAGHTVQLSALKGHVVLVNFWATWCHGCQTEIPWFVEFQQSYAQRRFSVVGISRDDAGWKAVRPYLAVKKLNYPVGIGSDSLAKLYGADELPVTLLIDKAGRIAARHAGVVRKSDCQAEIEALL